jgi:hypothetical protein
MRKKAKSPVKTKPSRHVRRDTTGVHPPRDAVYQAFDEARNQMQCGFGITRAARDELFFRAGAKFGQEQACSALNGT